MNKKLFRTIGGNVMVRRRTKGLKVIGGIMLLMASFLFGYYAHTFFASNDKEDLSSRNHNPVEMSTDTEKASFTGAGANYSNQENERLETLESSANSEYPKEITLNTNVIFEREFLQCGHKSVESYKGYQDMIGKTEIEIARKYKEWILKKFDENEVILFREVDDKCLEHYIVKEYNGQIGVFYQNKGVEHNMKQIVPINVSRLRAQDRKKLSDGIFIESDKELAQLLEDFGS